MTRFGKAARAINWAIRIAVVCLGAGWYFKQPLPPPSQMSALLESDPVQEPTASRPFIFEYEGAKYRIEPVREYSINGLIVTHNDVSAFSDIYHTSSSVDFRDLCLIWGDNVSDDTYFQMKFWSEPWSCHYQPMSDEADANFRHDQLSNNHLLTDNPSVLKTIRSLRIGDQVSMKGYLINYSPVRASEQERRSSLVRTDTGNGACEVMFVTDATVLGRAKGYWMSVFAWSKTFLIALVVLKVVTALTFPYLELRYR